MLKITVVFNKTPMWAESFMNKCFVCRKCQLTKYYYSKPPHDMKLWLCKECATKHGHKF